MIVIKLLIHSFICESFIQPSANFLICFCVLCDLYVIEKNYRNEYLLHYLSKSYRFKIIDFIEILFQDHFNLKVNLK